MNKILGLSILFLGVILLFSCGSKPEIKSQDTEIDTITQADTKTNLPADTMRLLVDLYNSGLAHGWSHIFNCRIKEVINGEFDQQKIEKLDLTVAFYRKWQPVLPDTCNVPVEMTISFVPVMMNQTFNMGYDGFLDTNGTVWEIVSLEYEKNDMAEIEFFKNEYIDEYTEIQQKTNKTIFERFNPVMVEKFALKKNTTVVYDDNIEVNPIFSFWFIQYETHDEITNALSALLNGFASDIGNGKTISIGQDEPSVKTAPLFALINEKEVCIIKYQCEHENNDWLNIKLNIIDRFAKGDNYTIMDVECGGPLTWNNPAFKPDKYRKF